MKKLYVLLTMLASLFVFSNQITKDINSMLVKVVYFNVVRYVNLVIQEIETTEYFQTYSGIKVINQKMYCMKIYGCYYAVDKLKTLYEILYTKIPGEYKISLFHHMNIEISRINQDLILEKRIDKGRVILEIYSYFRDREKILTIYI